LLNAADKVHACVVSNDTALLHLGGNSEILVQSRLWSRLTGMFWSVVLVATGNHCQRMLRYISHNNSSSVVVRLTSQVNVAGGHCSLQISIDICMYWHSRRCPDAIKRGLKLPTCITGPTMPTNGYWHGCLTYSNPLVRTCRFTVVVG
jgi:hypothetical protein